jgi:hypothetical protein
MVVVAVAVAYVHFFSLSNHAQILFDGLPVEKALELVMDVDVGRRRERGDASLLSSSFWHNIF